VRQRVDRRGVPVVEVAAEVLQQHEHRRPFADADGYRVEVNAHD
jgi:hypothetical protein